MCYTYVFSCMSEKFDFLILEAMVYGAPDIGSDRTSISKAIGFKEALFDKYSVDVIRKNLCHVCSDKEYKFLLYEHSKTKPGEFSWRRRSAEHVIDAIEGGRQRLLSQGYKTPSKEQLPTFDNIRNIHDRRFNGVLLSDTN